MFSYTVQLGDSDNDGIWIGDQDRTLKLDSGDTIQGTVGRLDAVLAHAALGTQSSHKVDGQPVANTPPVITTTSPISVAENTTAVTTTDADMDTLTWSKNGGADAARFGLTRAGVLTFASAPDFENPTDTGTDNGYAVTVRVSDGTATADLALTVNVTDVDEPPDAPGVPTGLTASPHGRNRIDLSWVAPTDTGGSAITGYRIEVSSDAGTTWSDLVANTGSTGATYEHTGLDFGSTRHYRVSAINAGGTGSPSNVAGASEGEGAYTHREATGGAVTSTLMSLHPFARYEFNDRTSVWGVLGYGVGGLTLTPQGQASGIEADLTTTMGLKLTSGAHREAGLEFGRLGNRREAPRYVVELRGAMRW